MRRLAFAAVLAAAAGYVVRSEAERRLRRRLRGLQGQATTQPGDQTVNKKAAMSVTCADEKCPHTLIQHDLDRKAMPCLDPDCGCQGFIDRAWL